MPSSQLFRSKTDPNTGTLLTESDFNRFVLHKSIPAQIRQLVLYISDNGGHVDSSVRELTFVKGL